MTNEQSTQTISDLIGKIATLGACEGYRTNLEFIDGELSFTAKPNAPFAVKDGEVRMKPAKVDYEAIGRDVVKLIGFNVFDPRKHLGDTFDESVKSWRDDIASVTGPSSDIVISIGTLNVNVG